VIKAMPGFQPGRHKGEKVRVKMMKRIDFILDEDN
jgi:hypothetical protein